MKSEIMRELEENTRIIRALMPRRRRKGRVVRRKISTPEDRAWRQIEKT